MNLRDSDSPGFNADTFWAIAVVIALFVALALALLSIHRVKPQYATSVLERSSVQFYYQTDPQTGCQYLLTPEGVTPRLGRNGRPLGCGSTQPLPKEH